MTRAVHDRKTTARLECAGERGMAAVLVLPCHLPLPTSGSDSRHDHRWHFLNARLIDPEAGSDDIGSLTVKDGTILARDGKAPKGATVVDCGGKCLAPGIVDLGVKIGEPGERHKESFRSAGLAAAAGGVTTIIARPDTSPAIDTPEVLEFVTRRARESPVRIRHMAALTKGRAGPR